MPEILINVINKIPQLSGDVRQITADNTDYRIRFVFDGDWSEGEKTVFFVREGGFAYPFAITENDEADVPAVMGVHIRTSLFVGVQQGDVKTSRPCMIPVYHAITDMIDDSAVQPDPTMWEGIVQRIMELEMSKLSPVAADAGMSKPVGVTEGGQLMTAPDVFWARYDETKYTDIRSAFESGKMCFLLTTNGSFPLMNVTDQHASFFGIRYQNDADLYRVTPADVWSRSQYTMVTSYDKTGNIDKDALTGKIPTDKAVYDAILKYSAGGGGTGTDLYGNAVVTVLGTDFDNLVIQSVLFPPGVTESTAQLDLLKSGAVKMFLMTESESDVACGILDCVSFNTDGDTIAAMFAGTVVGNGGTSFIGLDTDLNDTVTVFPMVANQGGSGGGAPLILIGGNGVPTDGEYQLFVPFTGEVYTFEMLREAAATRPVWLVTLTDADYWGYAYLTAHPVLPGATNDYITFTGRYWAIPNTESADVVPAEMIPVFGRYGADGVLKILPVEWEGHIKQTELDTAVQDALAQAKESGEFDGEPGQPGTTPHIGANGNWYIGDTDTGVKAQGEPGEPGQPGEPGDDYVLTADDKTEIAQEAAGLIDAALLSIIGEVE